MGAGRKGYLRDFLAKECHCWYAVLGIIYLVVKQRCGVVAVTHDRGSRKINSGERVKFGVDKLKIACVHLSRHSERGDAGIVD